MVIVLVYIFPTDTEVHPHLPPGWRWQVMVGDVPPDSLDMCANAGTSTEKSEASAAGDTNGASAARAMQLAGLPARYAGVTYLEHDPIPAGVDRLNMI